MLAVDLEPDPAGRASRSLPTSRRATATARPSSAIAAFGGLDTIVANAGFQHVAPVAEFDEDRWDALLALLLTSPFLLAALRLAALAASGDGRFLAIASAHGLVASPFKAGYVAAKHGVLGLVKTLALEGAEHGISATAVCPGFVRTPLVEGQLAAGGATGAEEQVLEDVILAPHALKRLIEPRRSQAGVLLGPAADGRVSPARR